MHGSHLRIESERGFPALIADCDHDSIHLFQTIIVSGPHLIIITKTE